MIIRRHRGVSIPEVLIVTIMLFVIAASLMPFFVDAEGDEDQQIARHHLQKLRAVLDRYRLDHLGRFPKKLNDLRWPSDIDGRISEAADADEIYPIPPYLRSLPANMASLAPFGQRNRVRQVDSDPPRSAEITPGNVGGWLYNPETGGVWIDHEQYDRY